MKKIFIGALVFFTLGTVVFAEDSVPNLQNRIETQRVERENRIENRKAIVEEKRENRKEDFAQRRDEIKAHFEEQKIKLGSKVEEKRQEIKKRLEERKIDSKTRLEEGSKERILKITNHIFDKSEAFLVKFDGIVDRIEERITKLKDSGADTSEAENLLDQAKVKIEDTTTLLVATKLELQNSIDTETSKEEIKITIQDIKTSMKETHASLVKVIESLKNLGSSDEKTLTE